MEMNQAEVRQALENAKFQVGQTVWHRNRQEWVRITSVEISDKRWNDYGIIEVNYICINDSGSGCWGYEYDFE